MKLDDTAARSADIEGAARSTPANKKRNIGGGAMLSAKAVCARGVSLIAMLVAAQLAAAQTPIKMSTVPAENTAALYKDPSWQPPRTSWGAPSLEGIWTVDDMQSVPRDRPEHFGLREKLTPEEFAERAAADADRWDRILNREQYSANSVGSRTFGWTSQIVDPPDGRMPPMNEKGRARARLADRGTYGPGPFNTFEDFHLYDRCITRGVMGSVFATIYGNGLRIVQRPDAVAITYEMLPDTRVIYTDGRPHVSDNIRQYMGTSIGRWEGDTLVVETTNFNGLTSIGGNGIGVRHSTEMKLTERLRRVDPEMIEYIATVDDPDTYTAPWTLRIMFTSQPGYEIFEYSCHERNRAVSGGLGGERNYQERAARALARGEPLPPRVPLDDVSRDALPEDESVYIDVNRGVID
jgi:hypothetical protein